MGAGGLAAAQFGGSAISAYGQVQQGRAEQQAANLSAQALELQARDAIARGTWEASRRRRETLRTVGGQRAALAASGLDMASGSPAALVTETQTIGLLDAMMIKTNAAREAWGFRTNAAITRYEGKLRRRAANLAAFNTLLGGGAQAAQYAQMGK